MSRQHLIVAVAGALIILGIGLKLNRGDSRVAPPPPASPQRHPVAHGSSPPPHSPPEPERGEAGQAPIDPSELESVIEQLSLLAAEYAPSSVPKIAVFLEDPRPEIRAAALEAMLQLGQRAAIPYLLRAAENAPTPDEAKALKEGADWLELPEAELESRPTP